MIIYSQQNKQDLITQDFQSNQAVGKPIGNKEKLGVSRNWMRKGGTVQWDDDQNKNFMVSVVVSDSFQREKPFQMDENNS